VAGTDICIRLKDPKRKEDKIMSIRIGILGYGNLGRGVECAVKHNPDMELKAVFTRRDPSSLSLLTEGVKVYSVNDILTMKDEIDVMIICGGSATDLPEQTPEYAKYFNVVDSFDTHAYLNELRHGNDTKESEEFHRRLDRYRERYLFPENQSAEDFDK